MSFISPETPVPAVLQNETFNLLPLAVRHAAVDYEAVMSSQEMLRIWSGSPWPHAGFTLAEKEIDLARHAQEHHQRKAFTYTVLDPERETCLGCVYIRPLAELVAANLDHLLDISADGAMARFWVRASLTAGDFERQLLNELCTWFRNDWPFSRLYLHTRSVNHQQIALFLAANLVKQMTLQYPGRGGKHHFYGPIQDL